MYAWQSWVHAPLKAIVVSLSKKLPSLLSTGWFQEHNYLSMIYLTFFTIKLKNISIKNSKMTIHPKQWTDLVFVLRNACFRISVLKTKVKARELRLIWCNKYISQVAFVNRIGKSNWYKKTTSIRIHVYDI